MARVPGGFGINDVMGVGSRSRAVSLGDVREQPVQRMGGLEEFLFWSRENPRPRGMAEPRDVSKLSARARGWVESMGFDVDDLHEPMADDLEDMAEAEVAEGDSEAEFDRRQTERTGQIAEEIVRDRRQQVEDAEAAAAAWEDAERDASVGDPEWDGFPAESVGLSARDRALVQSPLAMAGEGKRPWELTEAEKRANRQREKNRRGMEQIRKDQAERERRRTGPDQQTLDLGDPQSQMSQQYLADMFARQAAQPQQGYFGGLGQALGGMSTQQKIALLVGLGLIPMTGGASSSMLGPALGVGAGLAATQ